MAESKCKRNQKYDELEQGSTMEARRIGSRKPIYLDYDAAGRKKGGVQERRRTERAVR